ncbi:MAG: hypothetical protein ACK4XL_06950 [Bacteroidota bacterium]|jgi:hypothetical protein
MKKKLSSLICACCILVQLHAQESAVPEKITYLGFGTGINNSCGLIGLNLEQFVAGRISVFGAAGIGSWGFKTAIGGRYYLDGKTGKAIGVSFSNASGLTDFEPGNVKILENGQEVDSKGKFNLLPVQQINITWIRMWHVGKTNRMGIELGYSINISGKDNVTGADVPKLTDESRDNFNFLQPGGLIFGFSFNFGI